MFVEPALAESNAYRLFWQKLGRQVGKAISIMDEGVQQRASPSFNRCASSMPPSVATPQGMKSRAKSCVKSRGANSESVGLLGERELVAPLLLQFQLQTLSEAVELFGRFLLAKLVDEPRFPWIWPQPLHGGVPLCEVIFQ
jgi:hypothetical protein